MKIELTPRQQEIVAFIKKEINDKGYPPSVREIGKAVNLNSPAAVLSHLRALEKCGVIRRDPSKRRAIDFIQRKRDDGVSLPFPLIDEASGKSRANLRIAGERIYRLPQDAPECAEARGGDYVVVTGNSEIQEGDLLLVHSEGVSFFARYCGSTNGSVTISANGDGERVVEASAVLGRVSVVIRQFH